MSSAVTGAIRRGDRGLLEYATALINVNESAGSAAAGWDLAAERSFCEKDDEVLATHVALQDRQAED